MKLGSHDAVAVFAGMRALVFANQREGFFGDGAHALQIEIELQIEHRAHMQAAFARMGVKRALGAVAREHLVQPLGIIGEMFERHRAILDKRHGLAFVASSTS